MMEGVMITMTEPNPTPPHDSSEREASNGAGTVGTPSEGETLDHPVLDGSTERYDEEGQEKNPRYGEDDPALIRHPETNEETAPTDEH